MPALTATATAVWYPGTRAQWGRCFGRARRLAGEEAQQRTHPARGS